MYVIHHSRSDGEVSRFSLRGGDVIRDSSLLCPLGRLLAKGHPGGMLVGW